MKNMTIDILQRRIAEAGQEREKAIKQANIPLLDKIDGYIEALTFALDLIQRETSRE